MQDNDTTLLPGHGFRLSNRIFDLDGMTANHNDSFNFNGAMWLPINKEFWTTYKKWYFTNSFISLADNNPSVKFPLVVQSDGEHTDTRYPLVFSGSDRLVFPPQDQQLMFNLDFLDDSKSDYIMSNGSGKYSSQSLYGAIIAVENNKLRFSQTSAPYLNDQIVELSDSLNLTPTSVYTTQVPKLTVDLNGSVSFLNTQMDHINHRPGLSNRRLNDPFMQYLYMLPNQNLHLNSGTAMQSAPIDFNVNGVRQAGFDGQGQFIIGDGVAHEKLSIQWWRNRIGGIWVNVI